MPNLDLKELGSSGLNRMGGRIYEEFLNELSFTRRVRAIKEMVFNDPIIGAILFAIDMLIRQVSWRVQPFSEQKEDQEAANFLETCLKDMSFTWEDTISEILSMLPWGYSYQELVYKVRQGQSRDPSKNSRFNDGKVSWRKIAGRSQETLFQWDFDDDGGVKAMVQQPPPDYILRTIPIEKALLFRTSAVKNNPEGRSILRNAFRPWTLKKNIENIEGIGIERDLAGLPIAYVPPELLSDSADTDQKAILTAIKNIVVNVRRDEQEGIVFPLIYDDHGNKMYDFALLSTGGTRQFNVDKVITRYDQRIAMTVLADFILLGHDKVGSWALASSKTELFAVALGAWVNSIAAVFNRHAVPRLFELNGFNLKGLPELRPGDIESVDLTELGEYVSKLSGSGMSLFPDDDLENYLRQQASLPEKPKQDKL